MKIGVFICHCGENIGSTVDCPRVAKAAEWLPGVEVFRLTISICVPTRDRI